LATTSDDLICAIATPPGQGGIGIIRLSGSGASALAESLCNKTLKPRHATYADFSDSNGALDNGIAIYFPGPRSFTGEDVVELQGHGGPVIQQQILTALCDGGARLARPGEFSERAFANGKIDLLQAESIADLIAARSASAARAALTTLKGVFSEQVNSITTQLIRLRVQVEAAIDFPDEDIEILQDASLRKLFIQLYRDIGSLIATSRQGRLINNGLDVALVGAPNVGKSSLLNRLSGDEAAIVTDVPGTTRDLLKVDVLLNDLPIRLVDTAGLRDSDDPVEQIGIARAREQIGAADRVLLVVAADEVNAGITRDDIQVQASAIVKEMGLVQDDLPAEATSRWPDALLLVVNKIDLVDDAALRQLFAAGPGELPEPIFISAKQGLGLDALIARVADSAQFNQASAPFAARQRHVEALKAAYQSLELADNLIQQGDSAELIAEELQIAHRHLGEITGTMTPDDLLGKIFSEFCIGK